jgi:ABC-type Na+ efflux pump permease subunit
MSEITSQPKRTGLLIWLIVSQLLAVASLFFWLLMAGLSVMAFDSGVTQEAWNVVIAVWLYPIFPLVMIIGAWVAYAKRKNRLAAILSGLSFIPPALLFLAMWIQTTLWSITQ